MDGPTHFIQSLKTGNKTVQRPQDQLLDAILTPDGFQVIRVFYLDWNQQQTPEQKSEYLYRLLKLDFLRRPSLCKTVHARHQEMEMRVPHFSSRSACRKPRVLD